jgi:hypothetical protein
MKQTAVEWLQQALEDTILTHEQIMQTIGLFEQAKEMEQGQMGYTKADVIKAGEMGEICYLDTEHIVSYLDEAKHRNKTFNKEQQRELLKEMIQADEKDGLYDDWDVTLNDGIED